MFSRPLLALCVVLGLLSSADAQGFRPPGNRRMPELPTDPFEADGTVQAVAPPRIQMLTDSNQTWVIWVDPKAKVQVTGTAEADFLKTGMFIRFTVELDKRGRAKDKVTQLAIFTPSEQSPLGMWPEGMGPAPEGGGENFGGGFGGFGPAQPAGPPGGGSAGKAPEGGLFSVAGQIRGSRRGKLTVGAGRAMVQIELAEQPTIKVDFADYRVAKKGDRMSVRGKMIRGRMGIAQAKELTIELAQPLTGPRKKRPVRPTKPTPKRPPVQPEKQGERPEPVEVEPEKPGGS